MKTLKLRVNGMLMNNWDKHDWHINLIPGVNIGNQVWGDGIVINFSWIAFIWNINLWWRYPALKDDYKV